MYMKPLPSQEVLKEFLDYDDSTGVFTHRRRDLHRFPDERAWKSWNTRYAGKEAGCLDPLGYRVTAIYGEMYLCHRLAIKWMTGVDPIGQHTDHRDINPSNNAFGNIHLVTSSQNASKQSEQKRVTSSKYKGVGWDRSRGLWMAYIKVDGKRITLGRFPDELEAHRAYCIAALKYFGEFANFGKSSPFTRENLSATPAA